MTNCGIPSGHCCTSEQYVLPAHVFACIRNSRVVFLDLKRDKYYALDADELSALRPCLLGFNETNVCSHALSSPPEASTESIAPSLLEAGLITRRTHSMRRSVFTVAEPPTNDLSLEPHFDTSQIRFHHMSN